MSDIDDFYVHRCIVVLKKGTNGLGEPVTEESDPIRCFIDDSTRLVRDENGQHLIGSVEITCDNADADEFPLDSDVFELKDDGTRKRLGSVQLVDVASSGTMLLPDHTTVSVI